MYYMSFPIFPSHFFLSHVETSCSATHDSCDVNVAVQRPLCAHNIEAFDDTKYPKVKVHNTSKWFKLRISRIANIGFVMNKRRVNKMNAAPCGRQLFFLSFHGRFHLRCCCAQVREEGGIW